MIAIPVHRVSFKCLFLSTMLVSCIASGPIAAEAPESLKEAYGKKFDVGVAMPSAKLSEAERNLFATHFTAITPENAMKADTIYPKDGKYVFQEADALVDLARQNNLKVNGHTLVWHSQCPDWFFMDAGKAAKRDLVLKRMREHISTVVKHFRGKVFSWDVVNEAIADDQGYLRQSKWLNSLGEEFIAEAFLAAHAADPEAELYYNDYGIESPEKRAKTIKLIRELKRRNIRIDGIGIQGHWTVCH